MKTRFDLSISLERQLFNFIIIIRVKFDGKTMPTIFVLLNNVRGKVPHPIVMASTRFD